MFFISYFNRQLLFFIGARLRIKINKKEKEKETGYQHDIVVVLVVT